MDESILSLCLLVRDSLGKNVWFRMADVRSNILYPFVSHRADERRGESVKQLACEPVDQGRPVGLIAYCQWNPSPPQGERCTARRLAQPWAEVLPDRYTSAEEIIRAIRQGAYLLDGTHDVLIPYAWRQGKALAVHWPCSQMVNKGDKYTVIGAINKLGILEIVDSDIAPCRTTRTPRDERSYYRQYILPTAVDTVWVKPVFEIISGILPKHARKLESISQHRLQDAKRLIASIEPPTLIEAISSALDVDEETAAAHYDAYIRTVESAIDIDKGDGLMFQALIQHNAKLYQSMKEAVDSVWREENASRMAQAEASYADRENELKQLQAQFNRLEEVLSRRKTQLENYTDLGAEYARREEALHQLQAQLSKLQSTLAEMEARREAYDAMETEYLHRQEALQQLKDQRQLLEETIQKREAQLEHYSAMEADLSEKVQSRIQEVIQVMSSPEAAALPSGKAYPARRAALRIFAPDEQAPPREADEQDALVTLQINLEKAGVLDTRLEDLAAYLWAAYLGRENLLLAGDGGMDIAMALSHAVTGCSPAILRTSGAPSEEAAALLEGSDSQIILLEDVISSPRLPDYLPLMERFKDRMFLLLAPLPEALEQEPPSLYRYMLPLLTGFYVGSAPARQYECRLATALADAPPALAPKSAMEAIVPYGDALRLTARQKNRLAALAARLERLMPGQADHLLIPALWVPLALLTACPEAARRALLTLPGMAAPDLYDVRSALEAGRRA